MQITLWHYLLNNGDFRYSHWREGHQDLRNHPDRPGRWIGQHAHLDTTKPVPTVRTNYG